MTPDSTSGGMPFETTRWSVVLAAGAGDGTESRRALSELCRLYWTPAYVYLRRRGKGRPDAEDLTQEFFAHLLSSEGLGTLRPEAGRFRSYLLACLGNFLISAHRRNAAQRRGGGQVPVPLDALNEVERDIVSPAVPPAPDAAFDRRWAEVIVSQADAAVRREYEGRKATALFEQLRPLVFGRGEEQDGARIGAALGLRDRALRRALSRLRNRFRDALRLEVAQTLADPGELKDELRHLLDVLSQPAETVGTPSSP